MTSCFNNVCADYGKEFILTEKGYNAMTNKNGLIITKPIPNHETFVPYLFVVNGFVEEIYKEDGLTDDIIKIN